MPQEINHRLNNKRYLAIYYKTSGDYQKLDLADWEFALDAATGRITITFPDLLIAGEIKIHCLFDDRDREYQPVYRRGTRSEFANLARGMVRVYRVYERRYEDYVYDRNGNGMSETITTLYPRTYGYTYYPNSDRLKTREASDGTTKWAFVYDNNGNLIEKGNTYIIAGDTVTFTTNGEGVVYWQYNYDVFNKLVSVKKNGLVVSRHVYDPSGLRIVKEAAETRIYDYDLAGNIIGEKNVSNGKVYSYVWVTGRHLARVDGIIGGTEEKYFYECDHLGSPMVVTDQSGRVVWRGDFTPFGEKIEGKASMFEDTHGFTGKDFDNDTNLWYFNARWYDSDLGRFLSHDIAESNYVKPNSLNYYTYCWSNPLMYTDKQGLSPDDALAYITEYNVEIDIIAKAYGLKPELLKSVIWNENKYRWVIHELKDIVGIAAEKNTSLGMCQVQLATAAFLDTNPDPKAFKGISSKEFEKLKAEAYAKLTPEEKRNLINKLLSDDLVNLSYAAKYLKFTAEVAGLNPNDEKDQQMILETYNKGPDSWGKVINYGKCYREYENFWGRLKFVI